MSPQAALHGENPSGEGTCSLGEKEVGRQQLFYVLGFEVLFSAGMDGFCPWLSLRASCKAVVLALFLLSTTEQAAPDAPGLSTSRLQQPQKLKQGCRHQGRGDRAKPSSPGEP